LWQKEKGVHTLLQVRKPLYTDGLAEQIELAVVSLGALEADDPGSPVRCRRGEEVLKARSTAGHKEEFL
jgi:hypothetical protein